jgi:hypothetical protein
VTVGPLCPGGLVDNFDDANNTNEWGGINSSWEPAEITMSFAAGYGGSANSWRGSGTASGPNHTASLNLSNPIGPVDLTGFDSVRFRFYGDGNTYRLRMHQASTWDDYFIQFTPAAGTWTLVSVPLTAFAQAGWDPKAFNLALFETMIFEPMTAAGFDFRVDDFEFFCAPASPTPTASHSRTASPTSTRTASASATRTASPSRTPSPTASPSPSATASRTPSATPSATASRTPTPSASASRSPSPTATPSPTASSPPERRPAVHCVLSAYGRSLD